MAKPIDGNTPSMVNPPGLLQPIGGKGKGKGKGLPSAPGQMKGPSRGTTGLGFGRSFGRAVMSPTKLGAKRKYRKSRVQKNPTAAVSGVSGQPSLSPPIGGSPDIAYLNPTGSVNVPEKKNMPSQRYSQGIKEFGSFNIPDDVRRATRSSPPASDKDLKRGYKIVK